MERRNLLRKEIKDIFIQEQNGDYLYHLEALNLSEEGVFVKGKMITDDHEYVSYLSFRLPNGAELKNIPAQIIREAFGHGTTGVAYHFVNMDEEMRIELRKFLLEHSAA